MDKRTLIIILILLLGCTNRNNQIPTVSGSIIPDGRFDESDWKRSQKYNLPSEATLHLLTNEENVLLGIELNKSGTYIDVYISNDSIGIINLHASMQLGERLLENNWNDTIPAWSWGNNQGWTANTIRYKEHNEKLKLMDSIEPYEGFEFTISKQKLVQDQVWIRIEIRDFTGAGKNYSYPVESTREDSNSWLEVSF